MNLTRGQIEIMPAGKEMDELISEKIMGWHKNGLDWLDADNRYMHGVSDYDGREDDEDFHIIHWHPSESILWAWEIIEKFDRKMWDIAIESRTEDDGAVWMAYFTEYFEDGVGRIGGATADTAPLAICRAALIAFMEQE